jgi:hypothetical protein
MFLPWLYLSPSWHHYQGSVSHVAKLVNKVFRSSTINALITCPTGRPSGAKLWFAERDWADENLKGQTWENYYSTKNRGETCTQPTQPRFSDLMFQTHVSDPKKTDEI